MARTISVAPSKRMATLGAQAWFIMAAWGYRPSALLVAAPGQQHVLEKSSDDGMKTWSCDHFSVDAKHPPGAASGQ